MKKQILALILALMMSAAAVCAAESAGAELPAYTQEESAAIAESMNHPTPESLAAAGEAYAAAGVRAYSEENYPAAVEAWQKGMEIGSARCIHCMGVCYTNGRGVGQDDAKAFELYRRAAEMECADAVFAVGWCYADGRGVEQNALEAALWYVKALALGSAQAENNLKALLDSQLSVEEFMEAARTLDEDMLEIAKSVCAKTTYVYDLLDEGYALYTEGRDEEAAALWQKAVDLGSGNSAYNLACLYRSGRGVEKDEQKEMELYMLAAERGHSDAYVLAGMYYMDGTLIEKDYDKAIALYMKAVEAGDSEGYHRLGEAYSDYIQTEGSHQMAHAYYLAGAEMDNAACMYHLGEAYMHGIGVTKDEEKGVNWYRLGAEHGNRDAMYQLGLSYANGIGCQRDYSLARYWLERVLESGSQIQGAYEWLGYICSSDAMEEDYERAAGYYEQAVGMGSSYAMMRLGDMYRDGKYFEMSAGKALEYYTMALEAGDATAQEAIDALSAE